jgi:hypothetical protein
VFLQSSINNTVATKIAPHIKIPYVDNRLNAFLQKDMRYKHTRNIMCRISSKDYVTYFYRKNNLISYYRQFAKHEGKFIPNTTRNTYKFIEFEKDATYSQKPATLLAKTNENKWYVIAINIENNSKKYDMIIINDEITDDLHIKHIELDSNTLKQQVYSRIISDYPIYNDIFVILRSTNQQISLHFLSISENKFESAAWNLHDINELLHDILNNSDVINNIDEIVKISYIALYKTHYLYGSCLDNTSYVHGMRTYCGIKLKGKKYNYEIRNLYIYVTIKDGILKCYWDFSEAIMQIFESIIPSNPIHNITFEKYIKNPDLFVRTYVINEDKKCNKELYDNECYHIRQKQDKQEIISIGSWLDECQIGCIENYSLYHYKNYHIIICRSYVFKLAILDRKHDSIFIGLNPDFFPHTMFDLLDFEYHYSTINNKLVFLSNDLMHLFFIDAKKLDDILTRKYKEGCKDGYDKSSMNLVYYFPVPEHLLRSINNALLNKHKNIAIIEVIGSYIDKKSDKLYIAAKYKIEDKEYYGLFMWNMMHNSLNFRLLHAIKTNEVYSNINKNNKEFVFDISKLMLIEPKTYSFRRIKLMNLDIAYDVYNRFVSMKYNRISCYVPVPNVFQFESLPCDVRSVSNVENDLVVVYYDCSRSYPNSTNRAYFYFVLSYMSLVRGIPVVRI